MKTNKTKTNFLVFCRNGVGTAKSNNPQYNDIVEQVVIV